MATKTSHRRLNPKRRNPGEAGHGPDGFHVKKLPNRRKKQRREDHYNKKDQRWRKEIDTTEDFH